MTKKGRKEGRKEGGKKGGKEGRKGGKKGRHCSKISVMIPTSHKKHIS